MMLNSSLRRFASLSRSQSRSLATFRVDNPFTGDTYCEIKLQDEDEIVQMTKRAAAAQETWAKTSVDERVAVCTKFLEYFKLNKDQVAMDISGQMGKPLGQAVGEMGGLRERAVALMDLAPKALESVLLGPTTNNSDTTNFHREIVREPVGSKFVHFSRAPLILLSIVVLTLAPWNFPLLTAVNSVVPAILAGNAVVVNHGYRTPLVSEHFAKAFAYAGVPEGLVCSQKCDYDVLHKGIRGGLYDFVSFTGSVPGGRAVNESVGKSKKFIDSTLELGGNDGAYVAPDADLDYAVSTVVDGGLYNAGQSCCGIERAFVHESLYDEFVERAKAEVEKVYGNVGDPLDPSTNVGPMAQPQAIDHLNSLVSNATSLGARVVIGGEAPSGVSPRLFSPTLLADCDSSMTVMYEESFGPLIAIQKVKSQDEAIKGINGSLYGLTSVIFTQDVKNATAFAEQIETGTVFMNRADYLDPYLPWQGRKDTGKGVSLSQFGFGAFTKLKNKHFKFL